MFYFSTCHCGMDDVAIAIDLGAHSIKVGWANSSFPVATIPNCVSKTSDRKEYYGEHAGEVGGYFLQRPHDNGLLVDFNMQSSILDQVFSKMNIAVGSNSHSKHGLDPKSVSIVVTEPVHNPSTCSAMLHELLFEEFGFARVTTFSGAAFAPHAFTRPLVGNQQNIPVKLWGNDPNELFASFEENPCALVVDLGFSYSTIVPLMECVPMLSAIQRIPVGGRLLTEKLITASKSRCGVDLSFFSLFGDILKHQTCFVSKEYNAQMKRAAIQMAEFQKKCSVMIDFRKAPGSNELNFDVVLPPLPEAQGQTRTYKKRKSNAFAAAFKESNSNIPLQDVKEEQNDIPMREAEAEVEEDIACGPTIRLNADRISIPEGVFRPSDLGVPSVGVVEAVGIAIKKAPLEFQALLASNILLVGGSANLANLPERFASEVRSIIDGEFPVCVRMEADHPEWSIWRGASRFAGDFDAVVANGYGIDEYFEDKRGTGRRGRFSISAV